MAENDEKGQKSAQKSASGPQGGGEGGGSDGTLPAQTEESREAVLRQVQLGASATGRAKQLHSKEGEDALKGKEDGSTRPIAGGDSLKADFAPNEPGEPVGLQAEEATYTVNGTVPAGMVPSPSGPVPVASVTNDPEEAVGRTEQQMKELDRQLNRPKEPEQLTEDQVWATPAADLRALARDRGYEIPDVGGSRSTRRAFLRAQSKDAESGGFGPEGAGAKAAAGQKGPQQAVSNPASPGTPGGAPPPNVSG